MLLIVQVDRVIACFQLLLTGVAAQAVLTKILQKGAVMVVNLVRILCQDTVLSIVDYLQALVTTQFL
jgi:hypothetical protein